MAPAVPRSTRRTHPLIVLAAASFAATIAAYLLTPAESRSRIVVANLAFTWSTVLAIVGSARAWRAETESAHRRAWVWVGIGCAVWFFTQLVWGISELWLQRRPPYPSASDFIILAAYPCFVLALVSLRPPPGRPRRVRGPELWLDMALVTFIAGALAYHFLLEPRLASGGSQIALLTSVAGTTGSVAVVWLILMLMLQEIRIPLAPTGLLLAGLAATCFGDIVYAVVSVGGAYGTGHPLDLLWDGGILSVAAAAAFPAESPSASRDATAGLAGPNSRLLALFVGLAGILVLAVLGSRHAHTPLTIAILIGIGISIIGVRFVYSLRADRRYTDLLEREVAAQTGSLMDSLAATAAAERSLRVVMEAVPDAIVVVAPDGRILDLNQPSRAMVAATASQPAGRSIFDFLEPEPARLARENLAAAFHGAVRRFEVPFVRDDRTRGVSAVLYAPVREGGRVTKVLALARDITEQRRTEAQLQEAERLAALGQLVSGVAHEINNPAAIISGFAQTLLLDELTPEQRDMVKLVYDEATRIGRITSSLLAFARAGGRERTLVDLNDVIRRTFALRSYHLTTLNVTANLELDPADPHVWGSGSGLQQMVLNLLINAEQALVSVGQGRVITLRTRATEDQVRFECADTGPGIPAEIRSKIFDPFFTTKPEGVGTGLGLSICYGIVHDHGGRITVESDAERGTTFAVTLPRDPRTQGRPAPAPTSRAAAGAPLAVLLVDDEAGLRKAVARYLNRSGITVRAVADGSAALQALRAEDYDVIVSDVRMPGMSGRDFLERLRADRPELVARLIFSTGDTLAPDTAALLRESGVPSIAKPFDFTTLEQVLRDVAAAARSAA